MGTIILRGISTALLVTVLTLLAGMLWIGMGMGGLNVNSLVDIGLVASCLIGGYRTGRESGQWILGGIVGAGYVGVSAALLALFLPLSSWGVIQVLGEGALLGVIAGAFGAGRGYGSTRMPYSRDWSQRYSSRPKPAWAGYEEQDDSEQTQELLRNGHDWGEPETRAQDRRERDWKDRDKYYSANDKTIFTAGANSRWWEDELPTKN